jgi:hemerythrin-like domain-containing protein
MNGIDLLVEEHKNIVRMLRVVRNASYQVMQGEEICYEDFEKMIAFIRKYADAHHHDKEEKFLFKEMVEHLGRMGNNLVTHGMLVEHDWGRLFVKELEDALERVKNGDDESRLDVIANAVGYANHLARHIGKENEVVYTFAAKSLSSDVLAHIDEQTVQYEKAAEENGVQVHYLEILEEMEGKYGTCKM